MKKFTAILVALLFTSTLFFGAAVSAKTAKESLVIGLSTDEGGLNDKSFNQAADQGIKKAVKEFGVNYMPIESTKKEDYQPNLQSLVDEGAALTFGVGFQMGDALTAVAKANPDSKFAIIDSVVDLPNVESINFKAEEASFLVGVIAGKTTKTNKVGFIGGKDFALINAFEYGFYAGVKSVNPVAAANLLTINSKNVVSRKLSIYADSFSDTNKGKDAAKLLYGKGCDVIYHAAGGVGIGLFQAAKELKAKKKNVWAIGVDLDQAAVLPEFKNVILTSAMKRVDVGTYSATKDVVKNTFKGGKVVVLGLKEGGVGIAPTSKVNTAKAVLAVEAKYETAIKAGKIVVPADAKQARAFKATVIK